MNILKRTLTSLTIGTILFLFTITQPGRNTSKSPETQAYVERYTQILKQFNIDTTPIDSVSIKLEKLNPKYMGIYYPYLNSVSFNSTGWNTLSSASKEQLVFHELSHVLGLQHSPPNSIMQAYGLLPDRLYIKNYSLYINDMLDSLTKLSIEIKYDSTTYEPKAKEHRLTLEEIMDNEHAVVRFTASWCPPCKVLAPIFDEVAAENPTVKVYVVDVDQYKDIAGELNVRGIPTCIAIRNKAVDKVLVGAQPKQELEKLFK